jgi:hypothetical protein
MTPTTNNSLNNDHTINFLESIPENEELAILQDLNPSTSWIKLDRKVGAVAGAVFFFGLATFEICTITIPGMYRSPGDTIHTPLQINICKSSLLISSCFMIFTGVMALSTLCMEDVSHNYKKAMTLTAFTAAFFEVAPLVVMFV